MHIKVVSACKGLCTVGERYDVLLFLQRCTDAELLLPWIVLKYNVETSIIRYRLLQLAAAW